MEASAIPYFERDELRQGDFKHNVIMPTRLEQLKDIMNKQRAPCRVLLGGEVPDLVSSKAMASRSGGTPSGYPARPIAVPYVCLSMILYH